MKVALQSILPQFLQLLAQDFESWSVRDPSRGRISGGGLLAASPDSSDNITSNGSGGSSSREMSDNTPAPAGGVPQDWQPCDKDGEPVSVSEVS